MRFKEITEAPLPADWENINTLSSFKKRIEFAKEKAKRVGTGSSRVAFSFPYEGRNAVIKIAKNRKGISQNEDEISLFNDWYLRDLDIFVPIIDHDENNTWLLVEHCEKATDADFKRETGVTHMELMNFIIKLWREKERGGRHISPQDCNLDINTESRLFSGLEEFVINYSSEHVHVLLDARALGNWGKFNGNLVIIDAGFTRSVQKTHYSR